jgi:hypothetical protein
MTAATIEIPFTHRQSSHCESGVTSNLLNHYGHPVSEAMAFGIGQGILFGYLPFVKVNHLPLTTYRCHVGGILKRVSKRLRCRMAWSRFRNPEEAMAALDRRLEEGTPVGCRTGGYWLPYFPPAFRIHFNMHNLIVYGKDGDDYLISDPVFPEPVTCPRGDLIKARFAQGALAPRGTMYYMQEIPSGIDLPPAIISGIRGACRAMLNTPGPVIGVRGIRFLADRLERWPRRLGKRKSVQHLGQVIRMQEEIGTGGAGFRFMYAAFLQEAAEVLQAEVLHDLSKKLTAVGDRWREFALLGARNCKERASESESYSTMADILRDCAAGEEMIFRSLLDFAHRNGKRG